MLFSCENALRQNVSVSGEVVANAPDTAVVDVTAADLNGGSLNGGSAIVMAELDKFIQKLDGFSKVLREKVRPSPVTVGDIGEIRDAISKERVKKTCHYYTSSASYCYFRILYVSVM